MISVSSIARQAASSAAATTKSVSVRPRISAARLRRPITACGKRASSRAVGVAAFFITLLIYGKLPYRSNEFSGRTPDSGFLEREGQAPEGRKIVAQCASAGNLEPNGRAPEWGVRYRPRPVSKRQPLSPRSGADPTSTVFPVLTHWATIFRPDGLLPCPAPQTLCRANLR